MGDTAPSCRLAVIFASACRKAIIFRHGPAKRTRLIAWDRETDTFEPGQWMTRTRVYDERSDISPDGAHLLLFLGTFRPPFQTYTVLSRPPFYTALALWPKGDTWGGGGWFAGPREIVLDHSDAELAPGYIWPQGFSVRLADRGGAKLVARLNASREPGEMWQKREGQGWQKHIGGKVRLVALPRRNRPHLSHLVYALASPTREISLSDARWADFDSNGDVLFAVGGALHRLRVDDVADVTTSGDAIAGATLLADFSDMRFEPVIAPYSPARMLDDPSTWPGRLDGASRVWPPLDRVTKEDRRQRIRARKALAKRRQREARQ